MMPAITAVIPGHREAHEPGIHFSTQRWWRDAIPRLALRAPRNDGGSDG